MTRIRLEDLDPKTRKKILANPLLVEDLDPEIRRNLKDPRRSPVVRGLPLRCRQCGRVYSELAPAERHVNDRHGGGVIENVLPEGANVRACPEPEEST